MNRHLFLTGICIGLLFGVPIGAIGTLSFQRTLDHGFKHGLITGFASTSADLFYASVSLFSVQLIQEWIHTYSRIIQIIGSVLMILYGLAIIIQKKDLHVKENTKSDHYWKDYLSALLIALCNPFAIVSFLIAFSSFSITAEAVSDKLSVLTGLLISTMFYWILLSFIASKIKHHLSQKTYQIIGIVSGSVMILFGCVMFLRGV